MNSRMKSLIHLINRWDIIQNLEDKNQQLRHAIQSSSKLTKNELELIHSMVSTKNLEAFRKELIRLQEQDATKRSGKVLIQCEQCGKMKNAKEFYSIKIDYGHKVCRACDRYNKRVAKRASKGGK